MTSGTISLPSGLSEDRGRVGLCESIAEIAHVRRISSAGPPLANPFIPQHGSHQSPSSPTLSSRRRDQPPPERPYTLQFPPLTVIDDPAVCARCPSPTGVRTEGVISKSRFTSSSSFSPTFSSRVLQLLGGSTPGSPGTVPHHEVVRSLIHCRSESNGRPPSQAAPLIEDGAHIACPACMIAAEIGCATYECAICHMSCQKLERREVSFPDVGAARARRGEAMRCMERSRPGCVSLSTRECSVDGLGEAANYPTFSAFRLSASNEHHHLIGRVPSLEAATHSETHMLSIDSVEASYSSRR